MATHCERHRYALLLACFAHLACTVSGTSSGGDDAGALADSSVADASLASDASTVADAGRTADAAGANDGAMGQDAAPGPDAAVAADGGALRDAGTPPDAAMPPDAALPDAATPDAAVGPPDAGPCTWTPHPANPIVEAGWSAIGDLLMNDPSVMREGDHYRMWFSQGTGAFVNLVRLYDGTSTDGINWTFNPVPLLEPETDVVFTGSSTPAVAGTYRLNGELLPDLVNLSPAYTVAGGGWYVWMDTTAGQYRVSDQPGGDGTASWVGNGGTLVDGTYTPFSGTATGTLQATSAWDSHLAETPNVVLVNGSYHLYYSGAKLGDGPGRYNIGHATSADGVTWTRDPNNPVVRYHDDPMQWGYFTAAEPGVIYNSIDGLFYLYYTSAKYRGAQFNGTDFAAMMGIVLATSPDGSTFTSQGVALTQSAAYPVENLAMGYSTPFPLVDTTGMIHLFYDVAFYPTPGNWRQLALAHAVSADGRSFVEVEADIFTAGMGWLEEEVRAPSVLEEGGVFRMWFAGNNGLFFQPGFVWGLGYAESNRVCR